MATKKQIAAARKNIKKAQAANRKARKPAKRKAVKRTSAKRKAPAKTKKLSKKVGRSVVKVTGRTLYVGGATHAYKNAAAAVSAYKRIRTIKTADAFKARYSKVKRLKKVARRVTRGRNKHDLVGWTVQAKGRTVGKYKPRYLIQDVPPKNISKYAKKRKPTRRNPKGAAAVKRILRRHGYSV